LGKDGVNWAYYISSLRFSVLVNGTPSGIFSSFSGLRHRDPLSPLLFVIDMEALSKMISALLDRGFLSGFTMGSRSGDPINISHILFMDDTLILSKANLDHLHNLSSLFLCFKAVSSLKINLAKSKLVPVDNIINVKGLTSILGCMVSSLPMKYLDLPLGVSFKVKSI